jgi:hypothetical protein
VLSQSSCAQCLRAPRHPHVTTTRQTTHTHLNRQPAAATNGEHHDHPLPHHRAAIGQAGGRTNPHGPADARQQEGTQRDVRRATSTPLAALNRQGRAHRTASTYIPGRPRPKDGEAEPHRPKPSPSPSPSPPRPTPRAGHPPRPRQSPQPHPERQQAPHQTRAEQQAHADRPPRTRHRALRAPQRAATRKARTTRHHFPRWPARRYPWN